MKDKKANILDIAFAMIVIFILAIVFISVKYSYTQFAERAINNTIINSSIASKNVFIQTKDMTNRYDYVMFGILMGFTLAILVSAWFAGGHPIFAFVYFIALILIIVTSAILSFVWERVTDSTILTATAAQLPITNLILTNFPFYIAILGFLGMMIMFSRQGFTQ